MIHPTAHIVAAATFAGCPDNVAPAVAANVLHTAATRMADRGEPAEPLYRWAREISEAAGLDLPATAPEPSSDIDWAYVRSEPGTVWEPVGEKPYVGVTTKSAEKDSPETLRERLVEGVRMAFAMSDLDYLGKAIEAAKTGDLEQVKSQGGRSYTAVRLP